MEHGSILDDPEQIEAITLDRILDGTAPVRLVTHDEDDDAWQFLDGDHVNEEDARLLSLADMLRLDPSLIPLVNLPPGWYAWRADPDSPWQRGPGEAPGSP